MRLFKHLLQEVELANKRYGLFKKGDSLVAAVSGGPDSMALLALLSKLQHKYRLKIVVAHVNHGLLKRQSAAAQTLVKRFSEALSFPFYSKTIDLKALAKKNRRSIEEMGRMERYRFFEEIAKKSRSRKIVTAHTLDDQAETVLLRLLRGSGLRGLAGIPPIRKQGPFEVIRPLIDSQKDSLLKFLRESHIRFAVDRTNQSTVFTRNRVRHELIPALKSDYNPQIEHALSSLQEICRQTQDYMDRVSAKAFKNCLCRSARGKRVSLKVQNLKKLHPAVLREVLFQALLYKKGDLKRFSYDHVAGIVDLLHSDEDALESHLPGPLTVRKSQNTLDFI